MPKSSTAPDAEAHSIHAPDTARYAKTLPAMTRPRQALIRLLLALPALLTPNITAARLVITFTGDILLDRGVRRRIEAAGIDALFTPEIDSVLQASDFVIGNLECPATTVHAPAHKKFVFRAEPQWLDALRRHGFTHLNLANNHSVDQGRRGLEDTHRQVAAHGMTPIGAAPTAAQAATPDTITAGKRVFLLPTLRMPLEHFVPLPQRWSVSQEPDSGIIRRVADLRRRNPADVIIVMPHWGWEHHIQPTGLQRRLAYALIDAGADCIIGHHTHTMQTVEIYRGRHIYYSIGNFIFDQQRPINTRACMVTLNIEPDTLRVTTIPLQIRRCTPHIQTAKP